MDGGDQIAGCPAAYPASPQHDGMPRPGHPGLLSTNRKDRTGQAVHQTPPVRLHFLPLWHHQTAVQTAVPLCDGVNRHYGLQSPRIAA